MTKSSSQAKLSMNQFEVGRFINTIRQYANRLSFLKANNVNLASRYINVNYNRCCCFYVNSVIKRYSIVDWSFHKFGWNVIHAFKLHKSFDFLYRRAR